MYVTVVVPTGKLVPGTWVEVVITPAQLSVTVGADQVTGLHEEILAGTLLKTGACVSVMVTEKEQLDWLPLGSVTVKVFTVVPTGNNEPLGRPAVCTVVAPQMSVPTGVMKLMMAPQDPSVLFCEMLPGQEITGAMLSITVTVALQFEEFPFTSVTVIVMVLTPTSEQLKLVLLNETLAMPQLSKEPLLICAAVMLALPEALRLTLMF